MPMLNEILGAIFLVVGAIRFMTAKSRRELFMGLGMVLFALILFSV